MIKNADISFINQETLMCGEGFDFSYYPMFNGPQDMGYDLVDLGFDVVGMANNHMLDMGGAGLEAAIAFWKSQPVLEIGGYTSEEDFTYRVYEKDGVNIAFISYTYGTNGLTLYDGYDAWIPYLDEETVKKQVAEAKADPAVDLVFVSVHWGVEYMFSPSEEQKNYAQIMTDAGADVIIGHHPHVIEPVEWLTAPDGTKTLCVYSLGNFIGEQDHDYSMVGGMISFDIVKKGSEAHIEDPVFIPTVYYFDSNFYSNCVYLMTDFTDALASSHGVGYAYGNYTSLDKLRSYVTNCIDKEFLSEEFKAQVGLD
jgi:poly-gamma-glutamate synthesis protein (capsule biosynthesis protein)